MTFMSLFCPMSVDIGFILFMCFWGERKKGKQKNENRKFFLLIKFSKYFQISSKLFKAFINIHEKSTRAPISIYILLINLSQPLPHPTFKRFQTPNNKFCKEFTRLSSERRVFLSPPRPKYLMEKGNIQHVIFTF